jgi:hypothetical protein
LKMVATMKLMRQFEVMEDSKDGLGDFHEEWCSLESMLADDAARILHMRLLDALRCQSQPQRVATCSAHSSSVGRWGCAMV